MITALHGLLYGDDPEAARAFFRDVLQLPGADTGGGWLIFATGPSEVGMHPASWEYEGSTIQLKVPGAGTLTLYQPKYDPPALAKEHMEPMW